MNSSEYFILFSLISILFNRLFKRIISKDKRELLSVFYFFYITTSIIGAVLIMVVQDEYIQQYTAIIPEEFFYVIHKLNERKSFVFWVVLYSPFILLPLFLVNIKVDPSEKLLKSSLENMINKFSKILDWKIVLISFWLLFLFMLFEFYRKDKVSVLIDYQALFNYSNDQYSYIIDRYDFFDNLNAFVFGFIYIVFPFLSQILLFKSIKSGSVFLGILFLILFLILAYLSICMRQKAPLLIYVLITIYVCLKRGLITSKRAVIPVIGGFLFLNVMQSLVKGEVWSVGFTIIHTIIRVPHIYPYYIDLFPDIIPFEGFDFGQSIFGLRAAPVDNQLVMDEAFGFGFIQSYAAGAYQIRGYAQAGFLGVIVYSFFFSLLIRLFSFISTSFSVLGLAIFAQIVCFLYYMGQTHLIDCLWSSYGFKWVLLGLAILYFNSKLFAQNKNEANCTKP